MTTYLTVVLLLLAGVQALRLPDYIRPCSRKDPNFNDCALLEAKRIIPLLIKGDRKYGVPQLDPMFVKEVVVKESGITIIARDFTIVGAKDTVIERVNFDFNKKEILTEFFVQDVLFEGKYEIAGKLVALPISGKGNFNCSYEGLRVTYSTVYNLKKHKDGEVYVVLEDYDMNFLPTNAHVYFGNLFNGNRLLGDTMNKFMNDNWRVVLAEIGKPSYKALGLIVHQILSGFSKKVPYREIMTDVDDEELAQLI